MPLSTDNQDYGKSDEKNKEEKKLPPHGENLLNSDDQKGKKIDADVEMEKDRPAEQSK